jgi:hypothetical protein
VTSRPRADPRSRSDPDAVRERRARALEEPLDARVRARAPYPLLEVRNPIHRTVYLVMLPEFPSLTSAMCTCTDFARRGLGTCKHIEAGARWLADHADASPVGPPEDGALRPGRVWKRIDSTISAATREPGTDPRRIRRAGAVLFETPPT